MILGITGTKTFITEEQFKVLERKVLESDQVEHGACTGADEESHMVAVVLRKRIVIHPPIITKYMMAPDWNHPGITVLPHKPYQDRNEDIVNACHELLALPNTEYRPRSGTWNTIKYARSINKSLTICYPDGHLEHEL